MIPVPRKYKKWWLRWSPPKTVFKKRRLLPPPASAPTEIEPSPTGLPMFVLTFEIFDSDGDPLTVRTATKAMISGNYDLTEYVLDPGSRRRQAIDNSAIPGFVSAQFGEIELNNAEQQFDEWVDYATDGGKVTCEFGWYGDIYPYQFRTVYVAYIRGRPRFTDRSMRLTTIGREWKFDKKVALSGFNGDSGTYNGVLLEIDGLPGSQPRQILVGDAWYFKPILTNDLENVWFVCDNPIVAGSLKAFDGGVELARAGGIGGSAGGGEFQVLEKANGAVFIQPTTDIRFELRVKAEGLRADPLTSPRAWTIFDLAQIAGIPDADPGDLPENTVNFSLGKRLITTQTYKEIFDDVGRYQIATIWFNRLDQFCAREVLPSFTGDLVHTFRDSGSWGDGTISNLTVQEIPGLEKRKWRVRVRAGKAEKSALAGAIADGSIDPDMRDALSRDPYVVDFIGNITYNSGTPFFQASTILDKDPTSDEGDVEIISVEFTDIDEMIYYVGRYMALYGSHHIGMTFEAPFNFDTMQIELLDRVYIETARYGGNRSARVWLIEEKLKDHKIFFGVWSHRESDAPDSSIASISQNDSAATGSGGGGAGTGATGKGAAAPQLESFEIPITDKDTAIAVGTSKWDFGVPYDCTLVEARARLSEVQTSGSNLVQSIKNNGATILSTDITVENGDRDSMDAATQPVISAATLNKGDRLTFPTVTVGTGGKGISMILVVRQR